MGRYARKVSDDLAAAIVAEYEQKRRSYADIARAGIPGALEPGFIGAKTVGDYVNAAARKRERTSGNATRALEEALWDLLDDFRSAQRRYRRARKKDSTELRQLAATARELQRIFQVKPNGNNPTGPTDTTRGAEEAKPATLSDRLGATEASGAVRSHASAGGRTSAGT